jgi:hypothetical protein
MGALVVVLVVGSLVVGSLVVVVVVVVVVVRCNSPYYHIHRLEGFAG